MYISMRDEFDDSQHASDLKAFFALQFAGGAGFVLVLITAAFSRTVRRDPTWVNFCLTWVISVISYLLLSFADRETGEQPEHGLCLAQATLIYSAPVLTGFSTLSLVVQLWYTFRTSPEEGPQGKQRLRTALLVGAPYFAWIGMTLIALGIGLSDPSAVGRKDDQDSIYCAIGPGAAGQVSAAFVAASMLTALIFQVLAGRNIYRNWQTVRKAPRTPGRRNARAVALGLMLRVAAFYVFSLLSFIVAIVFFSEPGYGLINTFLSLAPIVAFLALGTQVDILRAWSFWRWFRKSDPDDLPEADGDGMRGKPSFFLN